MRLEEAEELEFERRSDARLVRFEPGTRILEITGFERGSLGFQMGQLFESASMARGQLRNS